MVKYFFYLLIVSFSSLYAIDTVSVNATVDSNLFENMPITGTLEITHDETEVVDAENVMIDGENMRVSLLRNVVISPGNPLMVSIYSFTLKPKSQGSYTLPSIKLKIGDKTYSTYPVSYQIQKGVSVSQNNSTTGINVNPELKLEAFVQGADNLYPGQVATLVYRYIYKGTIALTKEELPMFDADGMQMLGRKDIQNFADGDFSVFEISQQVQALKPGDYSWGPSVLGGVVFVEDALGNKQYTNQILKSEAPAVKITVKPFPDKGKPASFNGAFGTFTVASKLLTPASVSVNDPLTIEITISGTTSNFDVVDIPDLCCQPGFAGFFSQNSLPSAGTLEGSSKRFTVTIQPLLSVIKNIPAIQFSYFEPDKTAYAVVYTDPIPISVSPLEAINGKEKNTTVISYKGGETKQDWIKNYAKITPIDTNSSFKLQDKDLKNYIFAGFFVLWIPFILLLLYLLQWKIKPKLENYLLLKDTLLSSQIYQKLEIVKKGTPLYFQLLKDYVFSRLQELNLAENDSLKMESKALIAKIDQLRYLKNAKDFDVYKNNLPEIDQLIKQLKEKM